MAAPHLLRARSFNSRPHKEVDDFSTISEDPFLNFQLTTSQGGRHALKTFAGFLEDFQLTTSQGGRRSKLRWTGVESFFQLTTSQGGRRVFQELFDQEDEIFQLTTSQGGRPCRCNTCPSHPPFNSRPHKEVDSDSEEVVASFAFFQLTTSQGGRLI